MSTKSLRTVVLLLLVWPGCGDDDEIGPRHVVGQSGTATAPAHDPGEAAIEAPEAPVLPSCLTGHDPVGCAALPALTAWTCPQAWSTEIVGADTSWEHSVCNVEAPPVCASGTVAFLSESACHPIGTACPQAFLDELEYRALAPEHQGAVWFVAPGGQGTGAPSDPLGSVSDAVALAQAGDIIALAVGEYDEMVELNAAIAVVGACAAQTVLSPAAIETDEATVEIFAPGARLANLRVTGPEAGVFVSMSFGEVVLASVEVLNVSHVGIAQSDGGTVRLEDVVVRDTRPRLVLDDLGVGLATLVGSMQADRVVLEHNRTAGVVVSGPSASLDARDLVVRDTLPQSVDGAWGDGIYTEDGAVASFERVLCDGNADAAVSAIGSSVQLTDGVLRATEVQLKDQLWGVGIYAEGGAISGQRILMSDNAMGGVWAVGPGSEVTLADARVESSLGIPPYDQGGHGYHFEAGATGTLDRITSDANRGVGVVIRGAGTTVGGADVVVTNTLANSGEGGIGMGYAVVEGGEGTLERAWLEGNVGAGLGCEGPGGIDVEDLHVMETKSREGGLFGEGIDAEFGCQLGVQRAVLRRNHEVGIALVHSGTKAELREVLITDTQPQPHTNLWGLGVEVIAGADVTLAGAVSIGNRYAGVSVWGEGAKLTVTDLAVRETYSGDEDLFYGFGLEASSGASLTAARVDIEASRAVGVLADSPNTVANITDLSVFDTLRGDCATATAVGDWCEDPANDPNNAGSLVAWEQAELSVDRFELARSRCGVILARDASLTLSNGVVHGNAIGLNLRVPSYDTSLVMGPTVRYFDNGTNVDAVELLLPDVPTREMP